MRGRKSKFVVHVLFWSALWGLFEATAGYLLHLLPISIGWIIWFPAAYFFMERMYTKTGKAYAVLFGALFAASVKLLNLFVPGIRIDRVLNPAVSILLEAVGVFLVLTMLKNFSKYCFVQAIGASIIWRGLYLLYLLMVPQWMFDISPLADSVKLISFCVKESIINAAVIFTFLKIRDFTKTRRSSESIYDRLLNGKALPVHLTALVALDIAATLLL